VLTLSLTVTRTLSHILITRILCSGFQNLATKELSFLIIYRFKAPTRMFHIQEEGSDELTQNNYTTNQVVHYFHFPANFISMTKLLEKGCFGNTACPQM
jgi:hypothetical protein